MFSRCQIWRLLPLRHSAYKQKARSHSFTYGNKQRSILYAEKMVDQILGLKNFILQKLPTCEIIISTPTLRTDNTTANNRNNLFVNQLKKLNIKLILNDNIEKKYLNYRGLHLRMSDVTKLSENLVKSIQNWCLEDPCHVSTTKYIGNHSEFVSKMDLLPDLNVEHSETNSTVENDVNEFIEYLQYLRIEASGNLLIGHGNINSIRNKVDMLWLYVLVISRTRLRVNSHSIVAWMSRNFLQAGSRWKLEAGGKSEGEVTATGLEPRTT